MKYWWISAIVVMFFTTNLAFADNIKSTFAIEGNEINYEATNLNITKVHFSASDTSLVIHIITDKTKEGSMTLIMSDKEVNSLFSRGPLCKVSDSPRVLFLLIDGKEAAYEATSDNNFILKFDVPAGSRTLEIIGTVVVGVNAGPKIKEIPESGIYSQGQQVIFKGVFEEYCGNPISDAKIKFDIDKTQILSEHITDKKGMFTINFTIPENLNSGRYKGTLNATKNNLDSLFITKMLVQKNGESNIPFVFNTDFGSFVIPYNSDHGEIIDVTHYLVGNSLSVQYYATQNDTMKISFPKQLMDTVIGNLGGVTVRSNPMEPSKFPEQLNSDNHRVFDIPIFKGSNFIHFDADKYGKDVSRDRFGLQAVNIGGQLHVVPYNITGGIIQNLVADPFHKKLTVEIIGSENGGYLRIELPRNIIDSTQNDTDQKFIVMDSIERVGKEEPADFVEIQNDMNSRTLEIAFSPASRHLIEIQGTQMIPEFPFTMPVILILFFSLLVFYRMKYVRKNLEST